MILFDLQCDKSHRFEAWFDGNKGFETQVHAGLISCPLCGSHIVSKAPMAPHIVSSVSGQVETNISLTRTENEKALYQTLKHVQEVLEKHSEDVGAGFAEEARKIHYGEMEKKNIRGTTTAKEAEALKEEGVEFFAVPDFHKLDG